jgi:hypothetical protein
MAKMLLIAHGWGWHSDGEEPFARDARRRIADPAAERLTWFETYIELTNRSQL